MIECVPTALLFWTTLSSEFIQRSIDSENIIGGVMSHGVIKMYKADNDNNILPIYWGITVTVLCINTLSRFRR